MYVWAECLLLLSFVTALLAVGRHAYASRPAYQ
jgi:hypothetical protein